MPIVNKNSTSSTDSVYKFQEEEKAKDRYTLTDLRNDEDFVCCFIASCTNSNFHELSSSPINCSINFSYFSGECAMINS